jgi:hypothetical protein
MGTVVDDSTGLPLAGSRVHLLVPLCSAVTDALGRFRFDDVTPGGQRLAAGHAGYREFAPVQRSARAADTLQLELRLQPGGPLHDCRVHPDCAPLLEESAPAGFSDDERLRLAAFGTMIALVWRTVVVDDAKWYACIDEDNARVRDQLARRYGPVGPGGDCAARASHARGFPRRTFRTATGEPGFFVRIRPATDPGDGPRRVAGMAGSEGWECDFVRTVTGWRPVVCELVVQA